MESIEPAGSSFQLWSVYGISNIFDASQNLRLIRAMRSPTEVQHVHKMLNVCREAVKAMKAGLQHSSLMFCSGVSQQAFAPEDDIVLTTMTQLAKVCGQQISFSRYR